MAAVGVVLGVAVLIALYELVAREDKTRERTATDEMWAKSIDDFKPGNDEGRSDVTVRDGQRSSRSGLRPVRHEKVTRAAQR